MTIRNFMFLLFLSACYNCCAQQPGKLSLAVQWQPGITFYKNQYAYRWIEQSGKSSFNTGFYAGINYQLTKRMFAGTGLGFSYRKLKTIAFLNQATLPPPHYSETKELNNTSYVSHQIISFPATAGYYVVKKKTISVFACAEVAANFLMSAGYKVGNPKYDGTYGKRYWQGLSVSIGSGLEIPLSARFRITGCLNYSLINQVAKDPFLYSQDEKKIELPHKFLRFNTGMRLIL